MKMIFRLIFNRIMSGKLRQDFVSFIVNSTFVILLRNDYLLKFAVWDY